MTNFHRMFGAALMGVAMVSVSVPAVAADAALKAAVTGSWRTPENAARDAYRHPEAALAFWGLKPGMTVVDVNPGNKGWWTEILAPYAKATGGAYVAAAPNVTGYSAGDPVVVGTVKAYALSPSVNEVPAGSADMVLVARMFHNWARQDGTTEAYMTAFNTMLKPGGILAVEQHRAPEGSDPKAGTGYVPESYVIDAAKKAGFELVAKSEINANPKDTRDHPFGVWTLKPIRQSAARGQQPAADFDRAKYDAIGESDRMTLKFKKVK
ncbi:class I SAM-dependent methyltransferase [Asticcacaulis machinosus]|uniref:Methyltransferase n=1 Tax=Asticcacaulis machinosus TaxID=2984211 RepID=A0ABT5HJK4_9CAUL|nr:methyltransferase [Asticcacaulis machinosus]MDC7676426.1 methyltransferase [Asticcacaulis machinosus]